MIGRSSAPAALMASPTASWNVCKWPLRRKLRALWLVIVAAIFCTLPMLLIEMQKHDWDNIYKAWFLAGLSCVLTWTVTLYEVALHLEYFSCPPLQRHIVRILLMPPIYALDAWFCLRFTEARISLTPIREAYEAYTIYNFFMYLNRYLEAQLGPVPEYMAERATTVPHIWPVNYFSSPWAGRELFRRCRSGVLNYVILRPATACVMWLTLVTSHGRYEEGEFSWGNLWSYCTVLNNFSQCWALYVLMLFYLAVHGELRPLNPFRKFVTIKLVVFASFWQGLVITLLAAAGLLRPVDLHTYHSADGGMAEITGGLQDFLICIEMFAAAVGFAWSFPPRDYMTGEPPGFWRSFSVLFDLTDVMDDVQDRVHEEYREITTKPIQKIIAPLRNAPMFNKAKHPRGALAEASAATEMAPLLAGTAGEAQAGTGEPGGAAREAAGEASTSSVPCQDDAAEAGPSGAVAPPEAHSAPGDSGGQNKGHELTGSIGGLQRQGSASCSGVGVAGPGKAGLRGPGRVKQQSHVD